jgi:hypothetical protein
MMRWVSKLTGLFARKAPAGNSASSGGFQLRPNDGQGPFTSQFRSFVPRKIDPEFFEFLREAIPVIDAAHNRLVSLDGHLIVKGRNEALVTEIREWMENVPVNDLQKGIQAFHQNLSNEAFEQGFSISEFVTSQKRDDIVQLRVADSKFIKFKRSGNAVDIYQKSDQDMMERKLKPDNLLYFSIGNENQNPYGTPLMRSCEFVAQILVTIQNATKSVWERFGDPSFSVIYKTSKKEGTDLAGRYNAIKTEFDTALRAKQQGKSVDFIRAIDKDSELTIQIIGADGQVLEMEVPARHVLEQIIAKTGLPAWMLGMHWSTTERLSNAEVEVLLADVSTRQSAKLPLFTNLVKTLLTLRGKTWKPGDWWLEFDQVNLHDLVAQAQARFLNAQADMYYLQNAAAAGITIDIEDLAIGKELNSAGRGLKVITTPLLPPKLGGGAAGGGGCSCGCKGAHGEKELNRPVPWPELDKVETDYEARLTADWAKLQEKIWTILKLPQTPDPAKGLDLNMALATVERITSRQMETMEKLAHREPMQVNVTTAPLQLALDLKTPERQPAKIKTVKRDPTSGAVVVEYEEDNHGP